MSLGTRIAVLLIVLVAFFSVNAMAYDYHNFRLRIEDPATGVGRVLTDQATLGFGNNAGDENSAADTIYFAGFVEGFNVTVQATRSDGPGGGVLTLSGRVTSSTAVNNAQILITLEDTGYSAPAATTQFVAAVGGYDYSTKLATPAGVLTNASVNVQSWLDVNNTEPTFGSNSGSVVLNPLTQTIPPVGSNTTTAFAAGGQTYGTTVSGASPGATVTFAGGAGQNYSMFSQVLTTFSGIGSADFSLTASDPIDAGSTSVPEPTTLMLLGSTLVGLGILRRKKQI